MEGVEWEVSERWAWVTRCMYIVTLSTATARRRGRPRNQSRPAARHIINRPNTTQTRIPSSKQHALASKVIGKTNPSKYMQCIYVYIYVPTVYLSLLTTRTARMRIPLSLPQQSSKRYHPTTSQGEWKAQVCPLTYPIRSRHP